MKTAEDYFSERNGGKTASTDWITEKWAVIMMQDFADQQNKELREELQDERANGRIEWERFRLQDKDEIQRLTKEVGELTRLRELLRRSKDYIFLGYVGAVELCDAIDNELNPKP